MAVVWASIVGWSNVRIPGYTISGAYALASSDVPTFTKHSSNLAARSSVGTSSDELSRVFELASKAGGAAHVVAAPRRFFASPALACRARVSSASARISILPRRDRQVSITSPHHACMRKLRAKGRRVSNTPANVPASPRAALRAAPAPNASHLGVLVRGREADADGAALRPETAGPAPTPPIRNRPSGTAGSHRPPAAAGGSGRTHSRSASASFPAARGRPWSSRS